MRMYSLKVQMKDGIIIITQAHMIMTSKSEKISGVENIKKNG